MNNQKYTHYDNPPPWLIKLREEVSRLLCGCYEGDISGMWDQTTTEAEGDAAYSVDYGSHKYYYVPGPGQQALRELIEEAIKKAEEKYL